MASNRERQMNARATATQAGYMHHFVTAVSLQSYAQGWIHIAYAITILTVCIYCCLSITSVFLLIVCPECLCTCWCFSHVLIWTSYFGEKFPVTVGLSDDTAVAIATCFWTGEAWGQVHTQWNVLFRAYSGYIQKLKGFYMEVFNARHCTLLHGFCFL